MADVTFTLTSGTGYIELTRPKALNALSLEMIHQITEQLTAWATNDDVEQIEISGEGRAYCAGADVRWMREQIVNDRRAQALEFLRDEYIMDKLVAGFPKPVTTHLHGVAMGGGLGLGLHGTRRLSAPDLAMAMPETQIGLWPDVGMLFEFSRLPQQAGTWLAMTGTTIDAPTALALGLVDEVEGLDEAPELDLDWAEECFSGEDPVTIIHALESSSSPQATQAAEIIRSRSPLSVCVALEAIRKAATLTDVEAVLDQDMGIAQALLPDCDFVEGVRAQLVDKDHQPNWGYARIEDVDPDRVAQIVS